MCNYFFDSTHFRRLGQKSGKYFLQRFPDIYTLLKYDWNIHNTGVNNMQTYPADASKQECSFRSIFNQLWIVYFLANLFLLFIRFHIGVTSAWK